MPRHNFAPLRGELRRHSFDARSLRGNRLGDPSERELLVYLPPGHHKGGLEGLPLFVALAAFTGSGLKLNNWQSFGETLPQRVERLIEGGAMGPVVLVMPDAFTSLGGNQYLNSPVLGDWAKFVNSDLIEFVERELDCSFAPNRRAVFGHSSGGYGALMQGIRSPQAWGAVACHSGDMGFEWLYRGDLPKAARALAKHGGDVQAFLRALQDSPQMRGEDFYALMILAMAASYAPSEGELGQAIKLPIDLHTCELDPVAWARWLEHDPVELAADPTKFAGLGQLRGLFLDCGSRDEYNLHFGARRLSRALTAAGIEHTHEEFDGGHSKVAYRYDRSLPFLYAALADAG